MLGFVCFYGVQEGEGWSYWELIEVVSVVTDLRFGWRGLPFWPTGCLCSDVFSRPAVPLKVLILLMKSHTKEQRQDKFCSIRLCAISSQRTFSI